MQRQGAKAFQVFFSTKSLRGLLLFSEQPPGNTLFLLSSPSRVDSEGSPHLLNCLMYKLCYYRFGQVYTEGGKPAGYDRVRNAEIGAKDFELDVLDEAYTTEHWIVRIYKVKDMPNRGV